MKAFHALFPTFGLIKNNHEMDLNTLEGINEKMMMGK